MMKKRFLILFCFFALVASMTACGDKNNDKDTSSTTSMTQEDQETKTDGDMFDYDIDVENKLHGDDITVNKDDADNDADNSESTTNSENTGQEDDGDDITTGQNDNTTGNEDKDNTVDNTDKQEETKPEEQEDVVKDVPSSGNNNSNSSGVINVPSIKERDERLVEAAKGKSKTVIAKCLGTVEVPEEQAGFGSFCIEKNGSYVWVNPNYEYSFKGGGAITRVDNYVNPDAPDTYYEMVFKDGSGNLFCSVSSSSKENSDDMEYTVIDMKTYNQVYYDDGATEIE